VIAQCLADSLDNHTEFGVWGGMTERQRRALLKRRPQVESWRALFKADQMHEEPPPPESLPEDPHHVPPAHRLGQ
jgi:WhiB family redox-sensing transcriptional regulator